MEQLSASCSMWPFVHEGQAVECLLKGSNAPLQAEFCMVLAKALKAEGMCVSLPAVKTHAEKKKFVVQQTVFPLRASNGGETCHLM